MKSTNYDIIVIGGGSGGLNVASFFAKIEMSILLIDKSEENLGGDCLNAGCVPSKALIHVSKLIKVSKDAERFGVTTTGEVSLSKVMESVRDKQSVIRVSDSSRGLTEKGIDIALGTATFASESSLLVNGQEIFFKRCVLATGSRARELGIKSDGSVPLFSNETIFSLQNLPKSLVFIGGGPISCELGQAFSRLGSKVTIIHNGERILPREGGRASGLLTKKMEEEGIIFIKNASSEEINSGKLFYKKVGSEVIESVEADAIFVGIGRVLNIENLDLEKAGITVNENKSALLLDPYLRTTNKNIFAVGDVAGLHMFTHAAEEHAKIVINNMFSPLKKRTAKTMPAVTYTSPEIARFGEDEGSLTKRGVWFEIVETSFSDDDRAITDDARDGFVSVYLSREGKLLGGTMVGADAGDIISELVLLYTLDLPLRALFKKVYPYPIKGRINKKLASLYLSRSLTTRTSLLLRKLFALRNFFS
jgi:pyruvate/2-oxoglutarate dehydrogenase complex dihydrolipoamide dehydrogenase (E3) component